MFKVFGPILDPLTVLSFVAGATQRVGLGTNILIVPYRHPLILANEVASLDVLSGGRFVLGVGVGWNEEEFSALGISARERGRRTDEILEAMRQLWAGGPITYEGATLGTSPETEGGPPILVGGYSDAALRRALHFGEKWGGFMDSPERIRDVRHRLNRLAEEARCDPRELEIVISFRLQAPIPETEDSAERVAGNSFSWRKQVSTCASSRSHRRDRRLSSGWRGRWRRGYDDDSVMLEGRSVVGIVTSPSLSEGLRGNVWALKRHF